VLSHNRLNQAGNPAARGRVPQCNGDFSERRKAMTLVRQNLHVIAAAALLGSLAIATATPYQSANAQSGPSLVFAEQACLDHGVAPHTASFESCVSRAANAFDRGQPDVADRPARSTRDARAACLSYGLSPETLGYRQCVATQVDQRMNKPTQIRSVPPAN
jgi:hypothetical protein